MNDLPNILNVAHLPANLDKSRAIYIGPPGPRAPLGIRALSLYTIQTRAAGIAGRLSMRAKIKQYEQRVRGMPRLMSAMQRDLRGKDLVCVCAPKPCHGYILRKIANSADGEWANDEQSPEQSPEH